jgi:hypothetical protein
VNGYFCFWGRALGHMHSMFLDQTDQLAQIIFYYRMWVEASLPVNGTIDILVLSTMVSFKLLKESVKLKNPKLKPVNMGKQVIYCLSIPNPHFLFFALCCWNRALQNLLFTC